VVIDIIGQDETPTAAIKAGDLVFMGTDGKPPSPADKYHVEWMTVGEDCKQAFAEGFGWSVDVAD
jgi:hypothetical protein